MQRLLPILRHNWPLKVLSLLLAIIIWLMVEGVIVPTSPVLSEERKTIPRVPVNVLVSADIRREVLLSPTTVDVTVKGSSDGVQALQKSDIRLYVDVAGLAGKTKDRRPVQWSVAVSGVQVDSTLPSMIEVELR